MAFQPYERVIVIGAGPAGLTAGYELANNSYKVLVLEADPCYVGGIARTVLYKGFRFDIGGHRFYSKNPEIEALWTESMGDRMLTCSRLSRIYYRGSFFKYPLEPFDALRQLGPIEATRCLLSYLRERRLPPEHTKSFEDWVVSAFGRRLFEVFFKTYTEKVWGVPCSEISADWAAQRIRGLSLSTLLLSLFRRANHNGAVIKTLVDHFRYPACGPGEMWENVAALIEKKDGGVATGQRVVEINRAHGRVVSVTTQTAQGCQTHYADHFISTMSLAQLILSMNPSAPAGSAGKRRRAALPRLHNGCSSGRRGECVSRQLDLHTRSRSEGRANSKLQELERGNGPRSPFHGSRHGVFLRRE